MMDHPIAPEDLLKVICCNCKSNCTSHQCTCHKHGLSCVLACGHCHGQDCSNSDVVSNCNDNSDSDSEDAETL